jgi:F-type H+-transporting ATPase subunit b
MLIDWFTVVAQIVNFLVLVALLKHFLWGRLVKAIDDREKRIATRLTEAEEKSKEAERLAEQMRAEAAEQEHRRAELMAQAQREAEDQKNQILQQARDQARSLEAKWHEELEREQTVFLDELRQRAAAEILSVIRRALADLACADIQHCALEVFLEKLHSIDAAALHELASGELVVVSANELPEEPRRKIQAVLEQRLGAPARLQFARAPGMAWGIELRSNGRRIGWTPDGYVESLENNLRQALAQGSKVLVG